MSRWKVLIWLLIGLQFIDFYFTLSGLYRKELYEVNPILSFWIMMTGELPGLFIAKIIAVALILTLYRYRTERFAKGGMILTALFYIGMLSMSVYRYYQAP